MNQPKIRTLSDLAIVLREIDNSADSDMGFDMNMLFSTRHNTDHACGCAACIGGWVHAVRPDLRQTTLCAAVAQLGCTLAQATDLCLPGIGRGGITSPTQIAPVYDATPTQAARAVEILAETGAVDWPRALKEG